MSFATQLTADEAVFLNANEFAETVTYDGSSVPAIVEVGTALDQATGAMQAVVTLTVRRSDVPDPLYRDTVSIPSLTRDTVRADGSIMGFSDGAAMNITEDPWDVMRIEGGDSGVWTLTLVQNERPVV